MQQKTLPKRHRKKVLTYDTYQRLDTVSKAAFKYLEEKGGVLIVQSGEDQL